MFQEVSFAPLEINLTEEQLKEAEDIIGFIWSASRDELKVLAEWCVERGFDAKWFVEGSPYIDEIVNKTKSKEEEIENVTTILWGIGYDEIAILTDILIIQGCDLDWFEEHGLEARGKADRTGTPNER